MSKENFRQKVLKTLHEGIINRVEAKECLMRDFGKQEIPIFFFTDKELTSFDHYILGLEKMGLIQPIIRLDRDGNFECEVL